MSTTKTQISLGIYIIHCLDNKISIDVISKISRLFSIFCSCAGYFRPYLVTNLWSQVFSWSGSQDNVRTEARGPRPTPGGPQFWHTGTVDFSALLSRQVHFQCKGCLVFSFDYYLSQHTTKPAKWPMHREDSDQPGQPPSLIKVCEFGFNVAFNNFSVISRRCLVVTGSSMLTFIVLPHWCIMSQTLDMIPHPVTLSWHWVEQS